MALAFWRDLKRRNTSLARDKLLALLPQELPCIRHGGKHRLVDRIGRTGRQRATLFSSEMVFGGFLQGVLSEANKRARGSKVPSGSPTGN